jgi:MoaA/NifB/PqqE/SkfB family radical SAM enzyme
VQSANVRELRRTVAAAKLLQVDSISFLAADLTSQAFNRTIQWSSDRQAVVGINMLDINFLEEEVEHLLQEHATDIRSGFIREDRTKFLRIVRHFRAHLGLCEPEAPRCNAPWVSAVVEADGSVRPCFFHPAIANLQDGALAEVLNSSNAVAFRDHLEIDGDPICRRCVCSLHYQSSSRNDDLSTWHRHKSGERQGARALSANPMESV